MGAAWKKLNWNTFFGRNLLLSEFKHLTETELLGTFLNAPFDADYHQKTCFASRLPPSLCCPWHSLVGTSGLWSNVPSSCHAGCQAAWPHTDNFEAWSAVPNLSRSQIRSTNYHKKKKSAVTSLTHCTLLNVLSVTYLACFPMELPAWNPSARMQH